MNQYSQGSQNILTIFYEDIRDFIREQTKTISLKPKSIEFINTANIDDLLSQFIYFRQRYPIGRYRVYIPTSMCATAKYAKYKNQILHIKMLLETGQDIKNYLHNDIANFLFHDNLLKDWGIIHIHLSPKGRRKNHDNDILYAIQIADYILFLKIDTHDCFLQKDLLEILYQNCPEFFGFSPIPGDHFKEKDIKSLRNNNIGYALDLGGKSFCGGINHLIPQIGCAQILENLRNLSVALDSNLQLIKSKIAQIGYVGEMDVHLNINSEKKKIILYERNSAIEIRFSNTDIMKKLINCFLNLHLF
ncbi:MAG: hypothetical protein II913_03485 [Elusimicrobiaceae bacterium]|nr:hypothetical protein [Elusimicrobiaceae bacterium]